MPEANQPSGSLLEEIFQRLKRLNEERAPNHSEICSRRGSQELKGLVASTYPDVQSRPYYINITIDLRNTAFAQVTAAAITKLDAQLTCVPGQPLENGSTSSAAQSGPSVRNRSVARRKQAAKAKKRKSAKAVKLVQKVNKGTQKWKREKVHIVPKKYYILGNRGYYSNKDKLFHCGYCVRPFVTIKFLKKHLKKHQIQKCQDEEVEVFQPLEQVPTIQISDSEN